MKFEIQEILHSDNSGIKTVYAFESQQEATGEPCVQNQCEKRLGPNNDLIQQSWTLNPNVNITVHSQNRKHNYEFSVPESSKDAEFTERHSIASRCCGELACRKSCCDDQFAFHRSPSNNDTDFTLAGGSSSPPPLSDFWKSTDALCDIPPPCEFSDHKYESLADLTEDIASCQIGACCTMDKQQWVFSPPPSMRHHKDSGCPYSLDGEDSAHLASFFDSVSESDNYEPMFMRPPLSVNRSSYTKDFIQNHEMKTQMRNNSIATVECKTCLSSSYLQKPTKRRRTFPGVKEEPSQMQEGLPSWEGRESFSSGTISSYIMESLPLQAERLSRLTADHQEDERLCPFSALRRKSSQSSYSYRPSSSNANSHLEPQQQLINPSYASMSEEAVEEVFQLPEPKHLPCEESRGPDLDFGGNALADMAFGVEQIEVAESGFDEDMGEVEDHSLDPTMEELTQRDLLIQVFPTSLSKLSSQENSVPNLQSMRRRESVMAITTGSTEQRILQSVSKLAESAALNSPHLDTSNVIPEARSVFPVLNMEMDSEIASKATEEVRLTPKRSQTVRASISSPTLSQIEEGKEPPPKYKIVEDSGMEIAEAPSPDHESQDQETESNWNQYQTDSTADNGPEHWAKRRNLFKDSKQWSSIGGSSLTSSINEESGISEDSRSVDMATRDLGDKGFYTETFHCASWIYSGDEVSPTAGPVPPGLQPRTVTIRERTVKIWKGMGEYPWGFRIQFSKPIVVTEVDTNGAAEEAGLLVGDFVMAVNGIDVTSIPHSEAADLARQGPDLLTMTIGSDIGRGPNTPRPTCRGYLHKRTQSGLIKGWRRRWFVLRHDCCLYYYRHKKSFSRHHSFTLTVILKTPLLHLLVILKTPLLHSNSHPQGTTLTVKTPTIHLQSPLTASVFLLQDEGRKRALSSFKLEGADVGGDPSLGKPFVFKCCPLSANRVYYFSATSNLEMKRWLDAMDRAVHPVTQNHVWVDVTRHNASLPPLAVKNPECLGLLHQIDRNNKDTWVQHYCTLKDGCLYFYAGIRSTHALGGIYLHGYTVREQSLGSKKSTIELKPPSEEFKTFYLCAENPMENKRWILSIKASAKKWLPYHQAVQDYMNRPPEETRM
ncbi:unnamed protein product [Oncorhynchus mykiss]|uniref:PDZ and pleckstrin homology domains 1 n=1 Tax=Oncorhynchus mykiss TaxID=8022 RepID=A0A060WRJ3_ONCMY|nr:unnamed protein product [Oncorhynchus mykiss]